MAKSNVRKLKSEPQLTNAELQRTAEKLACALEHTTEGISLLTLLFTHLQTVADNGSSDLEIAIYEIKKTLFVGTSEADKAQQEFQDNAYANRGKLLQWPNERGA